MHVVDDDEAVRDALGALLLSAGFQVKTYATAVEFLEKAAATARGCVLSDVQMPGLTGLDLLHALKDRLDRFAIILLTGEADVPMAVEALQNGAVDFIEKPFEGERIISAAKRALLRLAQQSERVQSRGEYLGRLAALTERETEVLGHLVAGLSTKMIARELGLSPRTVDIYRANVMSKTRADSLAELVRMTILARGLDTAS